MQACQTGSNCCRSAPSTSTAARCSRRWQPQPRYRSRRAVASDGGGAGSEAAADAPGCVLGIDLGTTNSAAAFMEGGEPVIVPNQEGALTTPSVVAFAADGGVLVGVAAKRQAALNPRSTFHSVKRLIGKEYEEVEREAQRLAYTVAADEDGFVVLECPSLAESSSRTSSSSSSRDEGGGGDGGSGDGGGGEQDEEGTTAAGSHPGRLYPEEVSGHVLTKLITAAEAFTGQPVSKAVISVPAYFTDAQREATVTAGRVAGLETVRIIREPVAAALAYGMDATEDETVLVFDLGGGTFDVSLLEVGGGVIEVLSTGGDASLGGDDWDAAIVQWLVDTHLKPARVDCKDPRLMANLRGVAEAAKIKLSSEERVVIRMPVGGGIEAVLTRPMFEKMTKGLFRKARLPLDQACWQAGVDLGTIVREFDDAVKTVKKGGSSPKGSGKRQSKRGEAATALAASGVQIRPKRRQPVSRVLLVGGATRMPAIHRFVRNMTGLDAEEALVDPDLAVAAGAAVQAGIFEGQVSELMVMDVWQATLMRAFAEQLQREEAAEAAAGEGAEEAGVGGRSSGEEEGWVEEEADEANVEQQA
ncbi:hypothetical protein D9Q98_006150 [Chlorella vulgaris]|uniref:Uncharacterized protein n=1 Tax=Chlorella vulgaris TaxID=3077 RepID=A0A9D4TX02_CHLVU|nr:hypothetical protein D9Q98_006150 [Chlorella vulgaris]